jgi:hypothetical protein
VPRAERYFPANTGGPLTRVRIQAGKYTDEAIETLVVLMRTGENGHVRRAAANDLLDRAHGKPTTPVEITHEDSPDELAERIRAAIGEAQKLEPVKQVLSVD